MTPGTEPGALTPGEPAEQGVPERHDKCDHICLLRENHDGPHFYGYEHPSPRVRQRFLRRIAEAEDRARATEAVLTEQREAKDAAYCERDMLVALLSKLWPAHLSRHEGEWEDDWRNIVCVHTPMGQAAWHVHDSEMPLFAHLSLAPDDWDGHTTDEKYARLENVTSAEADLTEARERAEAAEQRIRELEGKDFYPFGKLDPNDLIDQAIVKAFNKPLRKKDQT